MTSAVPRIRVLLTKPPVGKYPLGYRLYPPMIPMGLGFLARALQDNGIHYEIADNYLDSFGTRTWDSSAYQQKLKDYAPTHVCVTSMSVEWPEALDLIRLTRSLLPECKVLVGGPHAHFAAYEIASKCDYVVIGEGERALPDVLLDRVSVNHVHGNIIQYPFIQPLDSLLDGSHGRKEMIPWCDFSPARYGLIMPEWGLTRKPIVNMNTSRGCPFQCKFCSILGPWGRGYRYLTAPVIVDEIQHLCEQFDVKGICFREDNFIVGRRRVEQMCHLLNERQIGVDWAAEVRVDSLDERLAELMARSGCRGLLFGVESGSERMLKAMNKEITTEETRRAFKFCKQFGIKTYASIVFGLPGESAADREITKEFIAEIQPDFVDKSVYLGIPGSAYYAELRRSEDYEYFDPVTLHVYPHGYKELYNTIVGDADGVLPY